MWKTGSGTKTNAKCHLLVSGWTLAPRFSGSNRRRTLTAVCFRSGTAQAVRLNLDRRHRLPEGSRPSANKSHSDVPTVDGIGRTPLHSPRFATLKKTKSEREAFTLLR